MNSKNTSIIAEDNTKYNHKCRHRHCKGHGCKCIIKLRDMKAEQCGTIVSVKAVGELGRRIRDMGIVPGSMIKVEGRAPLNDPVAIRVLESVVSLRNNEADFIEVEVDE